MFTRLKAFANSVVSNTSEDKIAQNNHSLAANAQTVPYSRPEFIGLTDEEVQVSADHSLRPILVPRDLSKLPWNSGYAE